MTTFIQNYSIVHTIVVKYNILFRSFNNNIIRIIIIRAVELNLRS
jgi:hypothetical protein